METKIFVVLSTTRHRSDIYVLPESHVMIPKLRELEKLGEINWFNKSTYTADQLATINFCCNMEFKINSTNNPDCLSLYTKINFPIKIVDVINLSIPLN